MYVLSYVADFLAGAFLCNGLPHLIAGLQGRVFPTPFADPPGRGDSSALVNFAWGAFNELIALVLLAAVPFRIAATPPFVLAVLGFVAMGLCLSIFFGRVQARKGHDV